MEIYFLTALYHAGAVKSTVSRKKNIDMTVFCVIY